MLAEPIPTAIWCSRLSKYHQETERHRNVGAVPGSMRRLVRPPCLPVGRVDAERLSASRCWNPHLHYTYLTMLPQIWKNKGWIWLHGRLYGVGLWQCLYTYFSVCQICFLLAPRSAREETLQAAGMPGAFCICSVVKGTCSEVALLPTRIPTCCSWRWDPKAGFFQH